MGIDCPNCNMKMRPIINRPVRWREKWWTFEGDDEPHEAVKDTWLCLNCEIIWKFSCGSLERIGMLA